MGKKRSAASKKNKNKGGNKKKSGVNKYAAPPPAAAAETANGDANAAPTQAPAPAQEPVAAKAPAPSLATKEVPVPPPEEKAVASDAEEKKEKEEPAAASSSSALPPGLEASVDLLTPSQYDLARRLCTEANQSHLFADWPVNKSDDKRRLMTQLERMDASYPSGGLVGYVSNAADLLDKSRRGVNPLEGWKPAVPVGESFESGSAEFGTAEERGLKEVGSCGFVLVAGGLGERLGYGGIKIGLPTEMATETSYIQYYIETILAFQSKHAPSGRKLPLCIMTSGDTNDATVALLKKNNNFGMDDDQITLVQQGDGVPALMDNDGRIALDSNDPYKVQAKPHGHGDVHALMHSHGVAKAWRQRGLKWAIFFQDTNGLAFHTLPLALGVSSKLDLVMNSIAVPRKAKQAIGAIAKLENEGTKEQRTINVEYNQLDPLLRATGYPDGDVNDKTTGYSPFPGNINQLLFQLEPYAAALERTKGAMPEFVNPKYKDAEKTVFKKPTRLECMMQDFPTVLKGEEAGKVGFTSIAADMCFSPVKNATSDGVALQQKGTHPGVAASGEADQYGAVCKILRSIGCSVEEANPAVFSGIKVVLGPEVVLKPSFVSCPAEYKEKFPNPSAVKISARSSLVVKGSGVVIESLDLDGALVIECEDGASGVISDLVVKNKGWEKVANQSGSEVIRMRGYCINKIETDRIVFKKDGSIEGPYVPRHPESASSSKSRELPAISLTEPDPKEMAEKKTECGGCVIL